MTETAHTPQTDYKRGYRDALQFAHSWIHDGIWCGPALGDDIVKAATTPPGLHEPQLLDACRMAIDLMDTQHVGQYGTAPFIRRAIANTTGEPQ